MNRIQGQRRRSSVPCKIRCNGRGISSRIILVGSRRSFIIPSSHRAVIMISDNAIKWNLDTFQSERCQDNFKKVWPKLFLLILLRPCHSTPTHGEWDILICTYFSYLGRYTIIYNTYNILVHILLVFPFPNHRWKWMLVLGKVISCCVFEIPRWLVTKFD